MKTTLTLRTLLELAIAGINNGRIEATKDLLQDALDQMLEDEKPKLNAKIN